MPHRSVQLHVPRGLWPLTWPMGLTMLRMLLLPVFLWLILIDSGNENTARPHRWYAMAVFAVMAITDKLDGYLARKLHQTSDLGRLLDPLADKLLIACSSILLSFAWVASPGYRIPLPVVAVIYGKDLFVAVGALVLLARRGKVTIRPRFAGRLSTVLQLTLVVLTLSAPDLQRLRHGLAIDVLRTLWWLVGLVAVIACLDYLAVGWRQFRERES
jgi:CDP-diacylglycerol--glycerol-3-phosphate 3-phosphatidyltransferase